MMRIEVPQQDRLQHTEHHRRQVGAPHAARAVIVLAAHHRGAEYPLRAIIVHRHFWTSDKHGEPVPVVMQAAQNLVLDQVEGGLLEMRLAAGLHLAQLDLQVTVTLDKGSRLLIQPQRLIPRLKTGGIEPVELANIFDPDEHPPRELWTTPCRL